MSEDAVPTPIEKRVSAGLFAIRLSPVVFLMLAAMAYVFHVEGSDAYAWRNTLPLWLVIVLGWVALRAGRGHWAGAGWRWPVAAAGFAIPATGLTLYLHYGFATDLDGMYSNAVYPEELFRFLPWYTLVAGFTGAAIGWIVGRNVDETRSRRASARADAPTL